MIQRHYSATNGVLLSSLRACPGYCPLSIQRYHKTLSRGKPCRNKPKAMTPTIKQSPSIKLCIPPPDHRSSLSASTTSVRMQGPPAKTLLFRFRRNHGTQPLPRPSNSKRPSQAPHQAPLMRRTNPGRRSGTSEVGAGDPGASDRSGAGREYRENEHIDRRR